ncbi:unnamed protein product [Miscanthus lutarioriparius]|uniref:Uncharacterized protein n=1 Tax=Miscanthus lutarioriparius TaxID=422564 RepID=A0A811PDE8_9POAL|nr:unnamed protein product [Miscanthus lutarioriparius]
MDPRGTPAVASTSTRRHKLPLLTLREGHGALDHGGALRCDALIWRGKGDFGSCSPDAQLCRPQLPASQRIDLVGIRRGRVQMHSLAARRSPAKQYNTPEIWRRWRANLPGVPRPAAIRAPGGDVSRVRSVCVRWPLALLAAASLVSMGGSASPTVQVFR